MVRISAIILCLLSLAGGSRAETVHAPMANPPAPLVADGSDLPGEAGATDEAEGADPVDRELPAVERLPLGGAPAPKPRAATGEEGKAEAPGVLQSPAVRTIGALTLVLSVIFGLRSVVQKAARRGNGLAASLGVGGRAPSGVLSVLGRYPVSKGASLVLLQLDRRVLLLSQTSGGFQTLCELTDAEDVASVVSKAADDEGVSMSRRFSSMLRTLERDPSIAGDAEESSPVSPRRAMALRDYEASLGADERAIVSAPGNGDSFSAMQRRLERLRGGAL